MKNIWLINYTGKKGGGPLDSYEMTRGLLNNGINVVAVVSSDIENLDAWKKLPLTQLIVIDTYESALELVKNTILFRFRQKKIIQEAIKEYVVDVVYCPMITFWTGIINSICKGSQVIEVVHDPVFHPGESMIVKIMYKSAIHSADKLIVHSKSFKNITSNTYKRKAYYIPLGRHSIYTECSNKVKLLEYDESKVNFLFFGTFSAYKGLDILAGAYKKLCEKYNDDITLTLIGSGDFSPYEEFYSSLPGVNVINRWIKDEEVDSIFHGENLVCVCPYTEATQSGIVMLAFEYGIPLIATDTGGMREQVISGKTGLLIKPSDVEELYIAMEKIFKDSKLRVNIAYNQKKILKKYDWDRLAKRLIYISKK